MMCIYGVSDTVKFKTKLDDCEEDTKAFRGTWHKSKVINAMGGLMC